jgi:hypothetical protein
MAQLPCALDSLAAKWAGNQVSLQGCGEASDTLPSRILNVQGAADAA